MLVGHTIKNRYRIYDRLGVGGSATVYLARDAQTGQMVVVKVVHNNLINEEFIGRFKREIDVLQKIDNEHVIRLFDWGLREYEDGIQREITYIVAEYVEGHTLADLIDTRGPLSEADALAITRQIALALSDIHRRGIVHRDVKSQNIMITPANQAKLIDFGIAKSADHATLTASSFFAGTLYYAAPEQILETKDVDHRADIYSLGVVLYEMLSGGLPVKSREFGTAASRIIAGNLDPLDGVSKPVEQLVMKMLHPKPARRPASADEVILAIEKIIGKQHEPSLPERPAPRTTTIMHPPDLPEEEGEALFEVVTTNGDHIPLTKAETIVGRSHPRDSAAPDIDLWALGIEDSRTASRQHCRIIRRDNKFFIEDLGSMNGTRLNNRPLEPGVSYPLHSGDQIMAGRVLLVFERVRE